MMNRAAPWGECDLSSGRKLLNRCNSLIQQVLVEPRQASVESRERNAWVD